VLVFIGLVGSITTPAPEIGGVDGGGNILVFTANALLVDATIIKIEVTNNFNLTDAFMRVPI